MHVPVHESGHEEAALEIGDLGGPPDEVRSPLITADIYNSALPNGDGLSDGTACVSSEDRAIAEYAVGGRVGSEARGQKEKHGEQTGG